MAFRCSPLMAKSWSSPRIVTAKCAAKPTSSSLIGSNELTLKPKRQTAAAFLTQEIGNAAAVSFCGGRAVQLIKVICDDRQSRHTFRHAIFRESPDQKESCAGNQDRYG